MRRAIIAGLLAALILSPLVSAEEAPKKSTPHILLIGISEYADKQIKSRPNAERDVKALYELFTSKDYLGADPQNIRMLLGKSDGKTSQPATRENILKELSWLADFSKRDDLAILVFIGEGGPLGDKSDRRCYFASDTVFKDRNKTAIAAAEVEERLKNLKSSHFCGFVDID